MLPFALLALLAGCPLLDTGDTGGGPQPLRFQLPVAEPHLLATATVYMDHDPEVYDGVWELTCTAFSGDRFPWCYDQHSGSDFMLSGGFDSMDAGSATVVAAADGEVVEVEDGHYDRCHGDLTTLEVSCDGHEIVGNHVILEHAEGVRTLYWHLMKDSVLPQVGDRVEAGQALGRVGSSGYSTGPHVHFEVNAADGTEVDPFAGPYSQEESLWCSQGPTIEDLPGGCD